MIELFYYCYFLKNQDSVIYGLFLFKLCSSKSKIYFDYKRLDEIRILLEEKTFILCNINEFQE